MNRKIKPFRLVLCALVLILPILLICRMCGAKTVQEDEPADDKPAETAPTLTSFLTHALEPVGSTLYVWGGGWNEADDGAGVETTTIGLSSNWKTFYDANQDNYNYEDHLYEIHNGLDCSGYVGWVLYNTLETKDGQDGYVWLADQTGIQLEALGLGQIEEGTFQAGDIVSGPEHVWISLGTCADGSVLLVHATVPEVKLGAIGDASSQAYALASQYMNSTDVLVSPDYATWSRFVWDEDKLADPDGLREKSPEEILDSLQS